MSSILALTLTASLTIPAASPAPSTTAAPPTLAAQAVALATAPSPARPEAAATRAALAPPGGDSLKNGAIIGGVVAAAAGAGFIYVLCRAMDDTDGEANCAGPSLMFGGLSGLGGAAVGAGIDALFARQPFAAPKATGKIQPGRVFPVRLGVRVRF